MLVTTNTEMKDITKPMTSRYCLICVYENNKAKSRVGKAYNQKTEVARL